LSRSLTAGRGGGPSGARLTPTPSPSEPPQRRPNRTLPHDRHRRKVCSFCLERVDHIDYKELPRLRRYRSDRAKILPRHTAGTCAHHQRLLTVALKRPRHMALLPFAMEVR